MEYYLFDLNLARLNNNKELEYKPAIVPQAFPTSCLTKYILPSGLGCPCGAVAASCSLSRLNWSWKRNDDEYIDLERRSTEKNAFNNIILKY